MRNSNTLKVLIFTRDISNNPEKLTIYARITVNGKRAEISLKRYVSVNEWDKNKGRLHGLTHKARLLNSYLDRSMVRSWIPINSCCLRTSLLQLSHQGPLSGKG
ncbi:Arm DNA-binding domain-containing protein [Muricauda sp. SK9]|uniref:Arm DNA-binding domain-containing protein n=1 Tax=Flavobacteriaceae TaxID=49546 RepID=UPI001FE9AC4D|nr:MULTISPECIES: Arm DNA-binding domain-containing protein [Allomuricauda]MDC6386642.1 Arm DNA-binding domain-containing protein [Muricauda sp. SK9]